MVSKKKRVIGAGAAVGALGALAALLIQVDTYMIDRKQRIAQMRFEQDVRECEMRHMRWFRGGCEPLP